LRRLVGRGGCGRALGCLDRKVRDVTVLARGRLGQRRWLRRRLLLPVRLRWRSLPLPLLVLGLLILEVKLLLLLL
jgi:hypothetical protein